MSTGRKGRGRQKIEMRMMSNESHLQVTFSKRRNGLFKKASELCTLSGADIALVVFSPSEKVFSFGHPHVDMVIDRYLSQVPHQNNGTMQLIEAHRSANVCVLNKELTEINNTLDIEKKYGDELSHFCNEIEVKFWWACPIDRMDKVQLELFKTAFEERKKLVAQHAERIVIQSASTETIPYFDGNASNSNTSLHHQGKSQQAPVFQPEFIQNPMFGFNNRPFGFF